MPAKSTRVLNPEDSLQFNRKWLSILLFLASAFLVGGFVGASNGGDLWGRCLIE